MAASEPFYSELSWAFDVRLDPQLDKAAYTIEALNDGTGWNQGIIQVGQGARTVPVDVSDYGSA